ncbi:high-potential iron-sulfur protein [Flavihumibacter profundi]|uniref:high-potential iron-sulfur protein n=1 Tax=Flavihumibacter profundi TaxID=2716883 RepID=UPI001CC7FDC0|nr:high-potential iron-sulfur protein [Flavihumibacter profundi]MBZ5859391.1 high-potential iron-sulfur protein [Flavihumibacter profundi]
MTASKERRLFFKKCIAAGMTLAGALFFSAGCQSPEKKPANENGVVDTNDPCNDSVLSKDDIKARESLGYVKKSPVADKHCGNCKLWLPPAPGKECGKCQLFKGTVPAPGYCTYWAPSGKS